MPLIKGAKPGSEGFKKNIEIEMDAGRPQNQSVAIAYSVAKENKNKKHERHHGKHGRG